MKKLDREKIIEYIESIAYDEKGKVVDRLRALSLLLEICDSNEADSETEKKLNVIIGKLKGTDE